MQKLQKPDISPDFTDEDIRKIKEYNFQMTRSMSPEQVEAFFREGAEKARKEMADMKSILADAEQEDETLNEIESRVKKPDISPKFTVQDIKKVREYHYELTKNMTSDEMSAFYRRGAERTLKRMAALRKYHELYP